MNLPKVMNLPKELLHIILEYDGRIKYRKGMYVNVIHKYDEKYHIIRPLMRKKIEIKNTIQLEGPGFYFEFYFDTFNSVGLSYDYNFSYINKFEICYYDFRNDGIKQIRTYL